MFVTNIEYEPDLAAISEERPVRTHPITREIRVVLHTMRLGPKAKMPEHMLLEGEEFGAFSPPAGAFAFGNDLNNAPQLQQPQANAAAQVSAEEGALQKLLRSVQQNNANQSFAAGQVTAEEDALQKLLRSVQQNNSNQSLAAGQVSAEEDALQKLFRSVQQNNSNQSLAAALLMSQLKAAAALVPQAQAPAPSADLLNTLVLQALQNQQNSSQVGSTTTFTNMPLANYGGANSLFCGAAHIMPRSNSEVASIASTPSMSSTDSILQSIKAFQAAPMPIMNLPSIQYPSTNIVPNAMNTNPPLNGMSTDQFQSLLRQMYQPK